MFVRVAPERTEAEFPHQILASIHFYTQYQDETGPLPGVEPGDETIRIGCNKTRSIMMMAFAHFIMGASYSLSHNRNPAVSQ